MNILVVDDRQLAVNGMLRKLAAIEPEATVTGLISSPEALSWALEHHPDVIFTDIEMPVLGGLEFAKQIRELSPSTNIVFTTAHAEYALDAHGLYPSGFLMKPVSEEDLRAALSNLRHPVAHYPRCRVQVTCFGNFDVFVDGKPLAFKRSKTKELFAYLIDRRGSRVTVGEVLSVLWEDGKDTASRRSQVRNFISDLRSVFSAVGEDDVIVRSRDSLAVVPAAIDCDYYRFLNGDANAVNRYHGEYMSQYSWAEMTLSKLGY